MSREQAHCLCCYILTMLLVAVVVIFSVLLAHGHEDSSTLGPTIHSLLMVSRPSAVARLVVPIVVDPVDSFTPRSRSHILAKAGESSLSVLAKTPTVANNNTSGSIIFKFSDVFIVAAPNHSFPNSMQQRSTATVRRASGGDEFSITTSTRRGSAGGEVHAEDSRALSTITFAAPGDNASARTEGGVPQFYYRQSAELPSGQIDGFWDRRLSHSQAPVVQVHSAPSGFRYPSECCGDRECRQIACTTITTESDGSAIWTGLHFDRSQVRMSGDAACHVCVGYGQHTSVRYAHCIFLSPMW